MKNLLTIFMVLIASPVLANVGDSNICFFHTAKVEQKENIKENILSTIALVETGRFAGDTKLGHPWPWTIAYEGKGVYFDTKQQAVKKVKELLNQGISSIDVGCMQVNLYYHGDAFNSIEQAFDPQSNVEYAAEFVNELYQKHGSWGAAATAYHSHNPTKASKYEEKLIKVWGKLKKHLASGGKLYDTAHPTMIASAFTVDKVTTQPISSKESTTLYKESDLASIPAPISAPAAVLVDMEKKKRNKQIFIKQQNYNYGKTASTSNGYELSQAEFANQWRANKLTEYRLKRGTIAPPVYRSNTNEKSL